MTLRSDTTSTVSKTLAPASSCSSARKCAVQAIELVLPDPAECWIRYRLPGPSRSTAASSLRVTSSWWNRGKMIFAIAFFLSRTVVR